MKVVIEFTEHAYDRLLETVAGVSVDELRWNPVREMNTAGKVMRHAARIGLILIPKVVEGTTSSYWDDDYEEKQHSIIEMTRDIEFGKEKTLRTLEKLKETDLEAMIPLWGRSHRRAEGLYMLVGELLYHAGQIALIRGAYRRKHVQA